LITGGKNIGRGALMPDIFSYQKVDPKNIIGILEQAVAKIGTGPIKLILLVGAHGAGKTKAISAYALKHKRQVISVGLEVSNALQQSDINQNMVASFLRKLSNHSDGVTLFDNTELLFLPALQVQPLETLKLCSRNRIVVATFPGHVADGQLYYADAEHKEFRTFSKYEIKDLVILDLNGE
jgi:hypothetical protein